MQGDTPPISMPLCGKVPPVWVPEMATDITRTNEMCVYRYIDIYI